MLSFKFMSAFCKVAAPPVVTVEPPAVDSLGETLAQIQSMRNAPAAVKRREILNRLHEDTAGERKRAWIRAQHPRIKKGDSGTWWCVSEHQRPTMTTTLGTKVYHRVGNGNTPREAYDSWVNF